MIALTISPAVILLFLRLLGFSFSAPVLSSSFVPVPARVGFALLVSMALAGYLPSMTPNLTMLLVLGVKELAVGVATGFVAQLPFYAIQIAGSLVDAESGFAAAQLLAPEQSTAVSLLGTSFFWLAIGLFVAVGGLRVMLADVVTGLAQVPISAPVPVGGIVQAVVNLTGGIFENGLMLALPALAAVVLANVLFGLLGRVASQVNPLQLLLGASPLLAITVLVVALPAISSQMVTLLADGMATLLNFTRAFGL